MLEQGRIIFSPAAIAGLSERCGAAQKAGDLGMVKRIQAMLAFQNRADEILGLFGLYRKMSPVQI